jgi:putative SOS response-associated peptidase YedK
MKRCYRVKDEEAAMCNRFAFIASPEELLVVLEQLGMAADDRLKYEHISPRYNIAPTQPVLVFRNAANEQREMAMLRWGLIPSWSRNPKPIPLLNARSETVAEKPSFRTAFQERRCIVPASGFYEWQHIGKKTKQPYYFTPQGGGLFPFAGLWECWQSPGGPVESVTILTVEANELVQPLHDRMPAILSPEQFSHWLDIHERPPAEILPLLTPYASDRMVCWEVSQRVNSVKAEGADLIARVPANGGSSASLF